MNAECKIESNGTIFRFCVTNKGYYDGGYFWTDADIVVENKCLKYRTSGSFLEFFEMVSIRDMLSDLISDKTTDIERMEFIEPDIQIILKPKHDLRNDGKYSFIKEGYEIEDVSAEFLLFPFLDGVMTEQHYVMPLYRDDIEKLVEYLSYVIEKLE